MNFGRVLIAGIVGGIALNVADFVMHGWIMGETYAKYPLFSQEQANPLYFTLVAVCIGIMTAVLFAKTRSAWAEGLMGGVAFGCCVGLISFFPPFYNSLVLDGFPYYMSWCQGGMNFIGFVVLGAVLGLLYKKG
jgi:hypothetical protein